MIGYLIAFGVGAIVGEWIALHFTYRYLDRALKEGWLMLGRPPE